MRISASNYSMQIKYLFVIINWKKNQFLLIKGYTIHHIALCESIVGGKVKNRPSQCGATRSVGFRSAHPIP